LRYMTRLFLKKILCLVLASSFLNISASFAYAWDPITHWYINKEANPEVNEGYFDLYCDNGTGPDMFVMGDLCDYVHSPDLNREEDFAHKPNFAYLMLKTRGLTNVSSSYYASGLGWGGHIAADWVAHDLELFPIPKDSDKIDTALYGPPHLNGEFLYDYYMFLTRGPIKFPLWFKPKQIQKALVNYHLIEKHENEPDLSDIAIKEYALTNSLSKSEIKKRIVIFNCTVAALHATLASKTLVDISTGKTPFFLYNMRAKGAEENIALSVQTVRNWSNDLTPRNHIPKGINPVRFYPLLPVPDIPEHLTCLPESRGFLDFLSPFIIKFAWAEPLPSFSYTEESFDSSHLTEATKYLFWLDVVEQAEQEGILQIEEKTKLRDGEEWFAAEVEITDDGLFNEIVKNKILEHIKNPSSTTDKKFAYFLRNFIIDQISDIDKLMDMTPPTISNLSPEDNSYTNDSTPKIYAYLLDDEKGIGIDKENISFTLNGKDLKFTYNQDTKALVATLESILSDGEYEAQIKASDKAGNETQKKWKFTVDTIPPEVDYEVLNKIINVKKETKAEIQTTTNEPTTFIAEIFRVKDKDKGNKGETVFAFESEEFSHDFIFAWDGKDNGGNLVENGVYTVRLSVLDRAKNTTSFEEKVNVNNEAGK